MDIAPGESPIGEVIQASGPDGIPYSAFVPHPLPSSPTIGMAAQEAATQAAMAVARLDQALSQLPEPSLLVRPMIRREAVSTSVLEGTYAALDEVLEADFLETRQMSNDLREVYNFVHATSLAMELTTKYPISLRVICELQKEIVKGTSGEKFDAGMLSLEPPTRPGNWSPETEKSAP